MGVALLSSEQLMNSTSLLVHKRLIVFYGNWPHVVVSNHGCIVSQSLLHDSQEVKFLQGACKAALKRATM
jgi:hypothetical protein